MLFVFLCIEVSLVRPDAFSYRLELLNVKTETSTLPPRSSCLFNACNLFSRNLQYLM